MLWMKPPEKEDMVHCCVHCGHENTNLERDEDGDLVCEECGHVIPEENVLVVAEVRNAVVDPIGPSHFATNGCLT